ncbi:GGDEF domain-containing protein [Spirulina subsalsa]|uniref:GGDEF domain-containing protein n=1 Tax=Spirulina subsalsa TaxID=54311 RepID=UPI0002EFF573|nr:GGDEF domain-containing protein [Spirulina subsalsa]
MDEVVQAIKAHLPDVVILENTVLIDQGLCQSVKQKAYGRWIYFLAINSQNKSEKTDSNLQSYCLHKKQILSQGVDEYLDIISPDSLSKNQAKAQKELFLSHLEIGLLWSQKCRTLMQENDYLSTIALCDPLTEIGNRRALDWDLPRQVYNARKHYVPLSIAVVDIDYFKAVNDNYGHLVGDRILQLLITRIKRKLRPLDTIFRYGGEEFVVVFKQANLDQAEVIAQRLRRAVAEQPFLVEPELSLSVTISLGIAELKLEDEPQGKSLLQRADEKLLLAKARGRNQVLR